jgi:nitroreductase
MPIVDDIKKIVEESLNAPSGSNSQPWKFKIAENMLEIFAFPEYDHPVLNYNNRGTWVAHGALIENITISARTAGYDTDVKVFPHFPDIKTSALIYFNATTPEKDILQEAIKNRCTNRKPYNLTPLSTDQKNDLLNVLNKEQRARVILVEDKGKIEKLCELLCINEVITLENKKLHELFFKEIVWQEKLARAGERGLYLPTMELAKPKQFALRLVKNWSIINFLNKFGFAKAIAKDNAKTFAKTPLMGVILASDDEKSFIEAGRTMERLWLKATEMKFSFHTIAGIMFYWQALKDAIIKTELKQSGHVSLIENTYTEIKNIFGNPSNIIALTFRVGFSENPTSLSYKKSIEEFLI